MVRDERIPWDPASESITVTTDSVLGSMEIVNLMFYHYGTVAGRLDILFDTPIMYRLIYCVGNTVAFPDTLPTEAQKTWIITYNFEQQILVCNCNGVEVLNVLISSSLCQSGWRTNWGKIPSQIKFYSQDTASDSYSLSAGK